MKKENEGKFKSKKILIAFMEFLVTIGCLITLVVMLTPKEKITKDAYSYSRPEEVSRYVVVNEYITRIRPLTEYGTFKEIVKRTLGSSEVKVYSDAEKTSEVEEGYISSGMIVESQEGEEIVDYTANVIGDMTGNGDCSVTELTQIIRHIVGLGRLETEEKELSGDFNGDKVINVTDVSMCINYIVYGEMEKDETSPENPEITITGEENEDSGWYKSNVNVKIISNAENEVITRTTIESKLENQNPTTQMTEEKNITLTENGTYKISSQNFGKNSLKSEIVEKTLNIDKTAPVIQVERTLEENSYKVDIEISDNNAIVKYTKQIDDEEPQIIDIENEKTVEDSIIVNKNGNYKFIAQDIAGNITEEVIEISEIKNDYTVKFLDEDGTQISSKVYKEGDTIEIPENPTKQEDEYYTYEFESWDKEIENQVTEDIQYTAIYNKVAKEYTITFLNEYGTEIIEQKTFKSTDTTVEEPNIPEKEGYIGSWEEYKLKPENINVKLYYAVKLEDGTKLQATDKNGIIWNFTYQDGKAVNVYYESGELGETVEIPAYLNGYLVTKIYNEEDSRNIFVKNYYGENRTIKEVILPNTLESIGDYAFYNCTNLEEVVIGDSVTNIGNYVFQNCTSLKSIEIPNSVTSIENYAFYNCTNLEEVVIGDSVTSIGESAFSNCINLEEVVIGNSVTSIGYDAFYDCISLIEIEIPNSVTTIVSNAFNSCRNLAAIKVSEGNQNYTSLDGVLFNKDKTNLIKYPESRQGKQYTIPNSVSEIGMNAFSNCSNLTNIKIGNNVTSIKSGAFRDCTSLIEMEMPNSVTNIENGTFQNCRSLAKIEIPNTVTRIGSNAFCNCESLQNIEIPNTVTTIDYSAFQNCRNLTEIKIPDSVENIGYRAFCNCTSLINLEIGNGVTTIASDTFSGCTNLRNIKMGDNVTTIGSYAFSSCTNLTEIEIPNSVTNINERAFRYCDELTEIEIPSSVETMRWYIFEYCWKLSDIYIDKLESETEGFDSNWKNNCNAYIHYKDCTHTITNEMENENIRIVDISNNLNNGKISCGEDYQFKVVDQNDEIVPNILVFIKTQGRFKNSGKYEELLMPDENGIYTIKNVNRDKIIIIREGELQNGDKILCTDENGITWNYTYQDGKAVDVYYKEGILGETVDIPSELNGFQVENIYNKSNRNIFVDSDNNENRNVKTVNIPEGIKNIGEYAFYYCRNLTNVTIPSSVEKIEYYAFNSCDKLENLNIEDGLIEIEDRAFMRCTTLKTVMIPSSVNKIGDDAFAECYSIANIYVDNLEADMDLGYCWNPYGYTHFKDCSHEITFEKRTNMSIQLEEISENTQDNRAKCSEDYKFKLLNKKGKAITSERVLVRIIGIDQEEYQDYERIRRIVNNGGELFADPEEGIIEIKANEEGIYTVENLHRDIKIIIEPYETTDENGITWNYSYEDGKAINVKYASGNLSEIVEIPERLDGYPVVSIYNKEGTGSIFEEAGEDKQKIETILLPNTVTEIGNYAFHKLGNLTNVEMPDEITTIGYAAFYGCEKLQEIEIPNSVTTLKGWAFSACNSLTNVIVSENVTTMGDAVFSSCGNIESIELLANIEKLGNNTFRECNKLSNIILSESIKIIGDCAFANCQNIIDLNIPDNVETIEKNAFVNCYNLKQINIPNSVTAIEDNAFASCNGIEEVNIPSSVRTLGAVFNYCYNLKDIYIDNLKEDVNVTTYNGEIGNAPNAYIHYKDSEYKIGSKIYSKTNLRIEEITENIVDGKVPLNSTVKFKVLDEEDNNVINEDVKIIELNQYENIIYSEELITADEDGTYTIENIRRNIIIVIGGKYSQTTDDNEITWRYTYEDGKATNVHYISGELGENLEIPETLDGYPVVSLYKEKQNYDNYNIFGRREYESLSEIKSINIPNTVEKIGDYAFVRCDNIESIEIPGSVTSIGNYAFANCYNLEEINIPDSVTSIGEMTFNNCTSLENIEIPNSVTSIENGIFNNCTSLESIEIPNSVTNIGYGAFSYCTSLESIEIPNSITSIGDRAFNGCRSLTNVEIGDSVTSIGGYAFANCYILEEITIPNSVTSIGNNAFGWCSNLVNVEISDNLLDIGGGAFNDTAFYNNKPDGVVYIGKVAYGYKGEMPKKTSIIIREGTKAISEGAFDGRHELKSIEMPDSVIRIGNRAFSGCTLLESVELPKNIEYIGDGAFSDCTKLKTIVIWDTIGGVGRRAFRGWRKDQEIDIELEEISEGWSEDWKDDCEAKVVFAYTGE